MGQYFYRPVESGYAEMGRGIGRGVEKSADILIAGKERDRQRKREDLELDVMLGKMGGGRGPRPTERYQPGERSTSVNADGIRMPTGLQAMETRDKPGFIESGDGDFYFEDPTRRAERLERESYGLGREREADTFELGQGREATERSRLSQTLGAPAQALTSGQGTAEDRGAFYGERMTPPGEAAPVRGTEAYYDMMTRESQIPNRPSGGADQGTGVGSIRHNRAFNVVKTMMEELNPEGYRTGFKTDLRGMLDITDRILSGDETVWDDIEEEMGPRARDVIEASMAGYGAQPGDEAPRGDPGVTPESVMSSVPEDAPASALIGGNRNRSPRGTEATTPTATTPGAPVGADSINSLIGTWQREGLGQTEILERLRAEYGSSGR
jgi:hypothetical protein